MSSDTLLLRFKDGIRKFNEGEFYVCHDILEDIWFDVRGWTRTFYQGIIHIAVGYYHITVRENPKGALSQLNKAINKLQPYSPSFQGVELEKLINTIRTSIQIIQSHLEFNSADFDRKLIPQIEFDETGFKDEAA